MPLKSEQILHDRYRILEMLGKGGFGAVYRAWDTQLDGPCAVKENLDTSSAAQAQFAREARLLFNLRHPGLPRVFDHFVIPEQGQYLVMDYIEGDDLRTLQERQGGPLAEEQVLGWMGQVCDALIYMHSRVPPVIHRDIKPANIRLTPEGQAVLVDFGIAKSYDSQKRTTTGARALTPGFAPPEQYGGGSTDAQSDIYSLAATCYCLLTGQKPPDSMAMAVGTLKMEAVQTLNPAVSSYVAVAVERGLQPDRTLRTHSASEFKAALFTRTPARPAEVDATVAIGRGGTSGVVVPVVTSAAVSPAVIQRAPQPQASAPRGAPARAVAGFPPAPGGTVKVPEGAFGLPAETPVDSAPVPLLRRLPWLPWAAGALLLGGLLLAGLLGVGLLVGGLVRGQSDAHITQTGETGPGGGKSAATPTVASAWLVSPAGPFSPLSSENAAQARQVGRLQPRYNDAPVSVSGLAWSPDGRWLAVAYMVSGDQAGVLLYNAQTLALDNVDAAQATILDLAFSPDGQSLALGEQGGRIEMVNLAGGDVLYTIQVGGMVSAVPSENLAFFPGGALLASGGNGVHLWKVQDGASVGDLAQKNLAIHGLAFAPDGSLLAAGSAAGEALLLSADGQVIFQSLPGHANFVTDVAWSPDGRLLASASADQTLRLWQIPGGQPLRTLSGHTQAAGYVAFSPDGSLLVSGGWDCSVRLWRAADGVLLTTLQSSAESRFCPVALSPDGRLVAALADDFSAIGVWGVAP